MKRLAWVGHPFDFAQGKLVRQVCFDSSKARVARTFLSSGERFCATSACTESHPQELLGQECRATQFVPHTLGDPHPGWTHLSKPHPLALLTRANTAVSANPPNHQPCSVFVTNRANFCGQGLLRYRGDKRSA